MDALPEEERAELLEIERDFTDSTPDVVEIHGLVVLKIIKHCQQNLPEIVTGQLLGSDIGTALEITSSFPFPTTTDDLDGEDETGAEYQLEMKRCLHDVNVDVNTVGWYTSTCLGSFLTEPLIRSHYNYQSTIHKAVVVVYDPIKSSLGELSLRAYRINSDFMSLYGAGDFSQESLARAKIPMKSVFEKIPIRIKNPGLVNAFLYELEDAGRVNRKYFAKKLDLAIAPFLEKNLQLLIESVDDMNMEQKNFQYYQRKLKRQKEDGAEDSKPIPKPSRLEALLVGNQIHEYCDMLSEFSTDSVSRVWAWKEVYDGREFK